MSGEERTTISRARGVLGEVRAEQFLTQRGMQIAARRYVSPGSEIDLIALDGETVVFVEVKTRTARHAGQGREAVTPAKQKRICTGALHYLAEHDLMDRQARFDVIEIQGERITHIKNAFPYCGPVF